MKNDVNIRFQTGDKVILSNGDCWANNKRYRTIMAYEDGCYKLSVNEEITDKDYEEQVFVWSDKELELYKPKEKVYTLIDLLNNQGKVFIIRKDATSLYKIEKNIMYFKDKHEKRWVKSNNTVTWFLKQEFAEYIKPKVDWNKVDEWTKIVINDDGKILKRYFLSYDERTNIIEYTTRSKFTFDEGYTYEVKSDLCELYTEE